MSRLQPDNTIFKDLCYSSSYDYEMDEFMLFLTNKNALIAKCKTV